jgi:hypothetical protein
MPKTVKGISFNIIRVHNTPHKAVLEDGLVVERKDKVFIAEEGGEVMCAPYSNHFVFLDPHVIPKESNKKYYFAGCTCSSPAVIVGPSTYQHLSSLTKKMLVCYAHLTWGKHMDGSS